MPTPHKRSTLLALLLLIAFTPGHAQNGEVAPNWPNWFQRDMQREAGGMDMTTVETDSGAFRFSLPAGTNLQETAEGIWGYSTDIGSEAPIRCYLYAEDLPMTALAVEMGELAIQSILDTSGAREEINRNLHYLDAGSIDGAIYIAFEWISRLRKSRGDLIGHTKVRAAKTEAMLQVCWHAEIGYRETFENIFTTFVETLQYSSDYTEPFAEDITVDTTNGLVTGATYSSLTLLNDGQFESYSYTTSILPVAPGEIQHSDSYYSEYSTADGAIVESWVYSVDNGEPSMELFLERDTSGESDNWLVSGEVQGTQVELQIPPVDGLKGEMTLLEETRELFAGDGESLEALVWAPFLDPTTFMELTFERDDDEVPYQGIARLGPVEMITVSDEHGGAVSGRMSIGPNTIAFERVWTQGIPTPPVTEE
ncbi:MAG: hypothetical protein QNI99_18055 [Woeseiaceae bacterium]|nr:hypothetical protein [Woeseiaceae bacterium]